MGTSPEMLRKHYDHVLVDALAGEFAGRSDEDEAERLREDVRRTRERLPGFFGPAPEFDGTQPDVDDDEIERLLRGFTD
jgi:hypothetical protein